MPTIQTAGQALALETTFKPQAPKAAPPVAPQPEKAATLQTTDDFAVRYAQLVKDAKSENRKGTASAIAFGAGALTGGALLTFAKSGGGAVAGVAAIGASLALPALIMGGKDGLPWAGFVGALTTGIGLVGMAPSPVAKAVGLGLIGGSLMVPKLAKDTSIGVDLGMVVGGAMTGAAVGVATKNMTVGMIAGGIGAAGALAATLVMNHKSKY